MSDDLIKKQGPSDGSSGGYGNSLQDKKDDEYGMEEFGYDLDSKNSKKDKDTDKRKKNEDESEYEEESAIAHEKDEEYKQNLDDLAELKKMREEKKEKDLKIAKDREEKREEEKKKKEKQWEDSDREKKEQEEKFIAGKKVEKKRVFTHKKGEGVFRHKKLANFNTGKKIQKAFKKVHGVSLKKKREFMGLLKSYNPSKTILRKKDFDDFSRRFKSKRFKGLNFDRMKKEGIDLKNERGRFGKRDLDKLRRGITGEKDTHKYQRKSSSQEGSSPKSSSSGITARMR